MKIRIQKRTHEAIIRALLETAKELESENLFVCIALEKHFKDYPVANRLMSDYLEAVLGDWAGFPIEVWLHNVAKVNPSEISYEKLQKYRRAWCLHMVDEFKSGRAYEVIEKHRKDKSK